MTNKEMIARTNAIQDELLQIQREIIATRVQTKDLTTQSDGLHKEWMALTSVIEKSLTITNHY